MNNRITEYIENCSPEMSVTGWELREIISEQHPGIYEKWSYGIPFFYYRKYMVYLNAQKDHWVVGFTNGRDMTDTEHYKCERLKLVLKVFVPAGRAIHSELRWKVQEALVIQDERAKAQ